MFLISSLDKKLLILCGLALIFKSYSQQLSNDLIYTLKNEDGKAMGNNATSSNNAPLYLSNANAPNQNQAWQITKNANGTYTFTGLSQGVFFVEHNQQVPTLQQILDDMHLLNAPMLQAPQADQTLNTFLQQVRAYSKGVSP